MDDEGLYSMQEKYNTYKEANIKFLRFNPDEETSLTETTDEEISWNGPIFSRFYLNPQEFSFLSQLLE